MSGELSLCLGSTSFLACLPALNKSNLMSALLAKCPLFVVMTLRRKNNAVREGCGVDDGDVYFGCGEVQLSKTKKNESSTNCPFVRSFVRE